MVGSVVAAAALTVTILLAAPPDDLVAGAGDRTAIADPAGVETASAPPTPLGTPAPESARVAPNGVDLFRISGDTDHDLPAAARGAYRRAAREVGADRPDCDLPWELLAGIGRVETDHGRYGGSRLGVSGVSRPLIRGIALDGVGPVAAISDTDRGRLDGDTVWDRAVGPMQFIPSTWRTAGRDGDDDGRRNPDDLDDASLAAAFYLCPATGTILDESVMRGQVFAYNHSDYYVDLVIAFAIGYHTGVFDIPPPPVEPTPEPTAGTSPDASPEPTRASGTTRDPEPTPGPTRDPRPTREPTRDPEPTPEPTQEPTPDPTPEPTAAPSPTPTGPPPPTLRSASGPWTSCGSTWCLSGVPLDLGGASRYELSAAEDFDADGTVEINRAELDGLAGRTVTVTVRRGTPEVYLIDALGYRNADGSFS